MTVCVAKRNGGLRTGVSRARLVAVLVAVGYSIGFYLEIDLSFLFKEEKDGNSIPSRNLTLNSK